MSPICESNSRFAVKSVGAHAKFAQQLIENIDGTLAAPLRTVCPPISHIPPRDQLFRRFVLKGFSNVFPTDLRALAAKDPSFWVALSLSLD